MYASLYQLHYVESLTLAVLVSSLANQNVTQIRVPFEFVSQLHSFLNETFDKNSLQKPNLIPDTWHPKLSPHPVPEVESLVDGALSSK